MKLKRMIKKLKKWQLPTLIMNAVIFYVVAVLSIIGGLEHFAYKNLLWWGHYVLTVACIALTVMYFRKIFRHVIKIKRGGFE